MKPNGKLKIEHGIPMPLPRGSSGELTNSIKKMKVGDSFIWSLAKRNVIGAYARFMGVKLITRAVDENNCRVWRIA